MLPARWARRPAPLRDPRPHTSECTTGADHAVLPAGSLTSLLSLAQNSALYGLGTTRTHRWCFERQQGFHVLSNPAPHVRLLPSLPAGREKAAPAREPVPAREATEEPGGPRTGGQSQGVGADETLNAGRQPGRLLPLGVRCERSGHV